MKRIDSETRRRMAQAFSLSLVMFAFPTSRLMFSEHRSIPWASAFLIVASGLVACFPLIAQWGQSRRIQHLADRSQWRSSYKASPESHLLHLNDTE